MAKCPHCPHPGPSCHGEDVPRLCDLVDPGHPDHDPRYLRSLAPPPSAGPRFDPTAFRTAKRLGGLNCLYAGPPVCSCEGAHYCHVLRDDANVTHCIACLKETPMTKTKRGA